MAKGAPDYYKMTDILAQSIGNLLVDINAQSLASLNVDIIAQSLASMDVDIIAQTIGNIDIDIAAQNIARLFNKPLYGGCRVGSAAGVLADESLTAVITVNGNGRVYGSFVELFAAGDIEYSYVYLQLDDVVTEKESIRDMLRSNIVAPIGSHFYLTQYDLENDYYSLALQSDVGFEEKCELTIFNDCGGNLGHRSFLSYAVI